jgi:isovaleryl-CoA dehydrogenase
MLVVHTDLFPLFANKQFSFQREFVESEVDPQALQYNREEKFNVDLFRKLGNLGLFGITVPAEYGGSGMDAVAAVIAHGKRSHIFVLMEVSTSSMD